MNLRPNSRLGGSSVALAATFAVALAAAETPKTTPQAVKSAAGPRFGTFVPTGKKISPDAVPGAAIYQLDPAIPGAPNARIGQTVATAVSPDGNTMLVLTSGYNGFYGADGKIAVNNEFVFVFDISKNTLVTKQMLTVPNAFDGVAWNPNGTEFYVSGGKDDNIHVFGQSAGLWAETAKIALKNSPLVVVGIALAGPGAAGVAVTAKGDKLVVANYNNDSIGVVDLKTQTLTATLDLRPSATDGAKLNTPGGDYPFWVAIKGDGKAYVSSVRDREIVVVDIASAPAVVNRIKVAGQPNKMILNKAQTRLYAAVDNSDTVAVIDTNSDTVIETFETTAPQVIYPGSPRLKGSNPNSLALSPDEKTLYVTNGGTNSLAVVSLAQSGPGSQVAGLIPTGWYPHSVSLSKDGSTFFVVNGKSLPGPNPLGAAGNQYVWQLTSATIQVAPVPNAADLSALTLQVADNNKFPFFSDYSRSASVMSALNNKIGHIIYIVRENRTYDQVLGDLEKGNGDRTLTMFPEPVTPNQHKIARQFVTLDNFYDTGEVSGNGWNWTTAARATDSVEKTIAINYSPHSGLNYDYEGTNRNINMAFGTLADRQKAQPLLSIPAVAAALSNLLPGALDISAPDGPNGEVGAGYLWDSAFQAGLTVRNYGFLVDLGALGTSSTQPFADAQPQSVAAKAALSAVTDPYFRGFDMDYPDYYRFKEWEREFDQYVTNGNLPNLTLLRLPHDHTGNFATAMMGVNTPELQVADNDYAVGRVIEKVAASPYAGGTLVFVIEDDAQAGSDHVDAHRSIAYVAGPYVKQGAVVSNQYTTVNMIRTIKDILGMTAMNINDGLAEPMADVFDLNQVNWTFSSVVPQNLRGTTLPLPAANSSNTLPATKYNLSFSKPTHSAAWWAKRMKNQNFDKEDDLDTQDYNRVLWRGLMTKKRPSRDQ